MEIKRKILIVDDDPRNIFALKLTLQSKGFDCLSALDAREGINIASATPDLDIILMDMMMPDMDGYQAIAELQNKPETATIPVIAVTAQAMLGDKEKCLEAGAIAYVSKPIDVDILLKTLKQY